VGERELGLAAGPHASLVVAEKSGHMIRDEYPEWVVAAIKRVLNH
jgi:hypothetical protein